LVLLAVKCLGIAIRVLSNVLCLDLLVGLHRTLLVGCRRLGNEAVAKLDQMALVVVQSLLLKVVGALVDVA